MAEFIQTNLHLYGPFAVFLLLMLSGIGLPLGEDVITIPAGMLVEEGVMELWPVLIATYLGVVCSDVLWFAVCRHYGTPLLHKRWMKRLVHPRRLLEAKHQFQERGTWLVIMSRFIPSSRTTTITIAGMLHMPLWKFALATAGCVLITAPMQVGLGYLVGAGMGEDKPNLVLMLIGLVVLITALTFGLTWWTQHRRSKRRAPRARAAWLRQFRPRRPGRRRTTESTPPQ